MYFVFLYLMFCILSILLMSRDFQESSPALQFKGIYSLAFYLLYGPALATVCDHWSKGTNLIRRVSPGDLMYSLMIIANNIVLCM